MSSYMKPVQFIQYTQKTVKHQNDLSNSHSVNIKMLQLSWCLPNRYASDYSNCTTQSENFWTFEDKLSLNLHLAVVKVQQYFKVVSSCDTLKYNRPNQNSRIIPKVKSKIIQGYIHGNAKIYLRYLDLIQGYI